ncbi:phage tail tube protein [Rhodococcus pyridinivorans]|uniref:phage tail tube protein n=1 Tax=Rhodococcus pyridinivorans TaxID=103816 RepID=UPI000A6E907B|nr:phage tail tube protein [Rhodococcus pyridinivorans]
MATFDPYIGRREAIGLGIETTPGTAVAPQVWLRWLDQPLNTRTEVLENESAMGVVDRVNDSEVATAWSEGTPGGKVTDNAVGYLLLGIFGDVSTGTVSSGIYPHTFSVRQSSIPRTLTFVRSGPAGSYRHPYATVDTFELTAEEKGWVQVSCAVKARTGVSSTETPAIAPEKEFTSKNIVLKLADTVGNLSGAAPVKARSLTLTIERPSEQFDALGTNNEPEFDRGTFEARGEFVVRHTTDQHETDMLENTIKALSIALTNDTTSLTFTASKVRFREIDTDRSRDNVVTQTVQFFCEFDTATNKSIDAVLRNATASYVAA